MNPDKLHDRIMGCWLGKAVGGTLGMPFEGCAGPLQVDPGRMARRMLPNDDLDLQLLWIRVLEQYGPQTRAAHLAQAAADHYACYPDEYGIARWNTARGWRPPVTGRHNNAFGDGMGGAIRSEIWACLAPGRPALAAALAREDALVDHHGNGVWAEMFLAALESHLLTTPDLPGAIQSGLHVIPPESKLARALRSVVAQHAQQLPPEALRRQLLTDYPSHNFTDVTLNLAFILIGLLHGRGDFIRSIVLAVNCGLDTDCTGATCGSILGLLHGAASLPADIRARAGQAVACHPSLDGLSLPQTLDELTARTLRLQAQWATLPDGPLDNPTPATAPPPHDPCEWLVLAQPVEDGAPDEPPALLAARRNPRQAHALRRTFNGIHLDLTDCVPRPGDALYLTTWLTTGPARAARLMCCADVGLTAWWDGQLVINYHGRRPALPAFHRTEGGATVPVPVTPGHPHELRIRLLTGAGPLTCTAALGDDQGRYLQPVRYAFEKTPT